jgi:hypothetical protein
MDLDRDGVLSVLKSKGVSWLYHANTVGTACSFLAAGGLLSREAVETKGLKQSPQYTDGDDKRFGVWNDIWLDGVDIHSRTGKRNLYGPILFCYDVSFLTGRNLPPVRITKTHPEKWSGKTDEGKYFLSVEEIAKHYNPKTFDHSITLHNTLDPLSFDALKEVVVDDPKRLIDGKNVFDLAVAALRSAAMKSGNSGFALRQRHQKSTAMAVGCKCDEQYRKMTEADLKRIFLP